MREVEDVPFVANEQRMSTESDEYSFAENMNALCESEQRRSSTSQLAKRDMPKKFSGSYGQYTQKLKQKMKDGSVVDDMHGKIRINNLQRERSRNQDLQNYLS